MQIDKFAGMVKFSLSESERATIEDQSRVLVDSFGLLKNIDTDGVDAMFTVLDIKNVLREDVVAKNISKETLLSNAPEQYGGYFQVPKTVD
ncbi:MAG: Asp-tRNA(Asn)/Glu-tRNA(Gln) amidotransferase subunit GatC [Defluviitaleaceae bacterium]|nr:Asp-tRNA(Asn)/Glu-tRNA(Gln) amidotransferase subunit GatC [Defluviitaleaceae bacterium]